MEEENKESNQCRYYEERRAELAKIRSDSMDSFDKSILQVSTGALVITITFIDKIGKPYDYFTNFLLIIFWSLFLGVILVNIFSYWSAQKNMDFKINNLDARFRKYHGDWQCIPEQFSRWKLCTEICNQIALWCFVAGAILFFTYAFMVQNHNYQTSNKKEVTIMEDDKKIRFQDGKTEATEKQPSKKVEPVKVPENHKNKGK